MIKMMRLIGVSAAVMQGVCGSNVVAAVVSNAAYTEVPLSAVRPMGMIRDRLQKQRTGLADHRKDSGYPFDTCLWAGRIPDGGNPNGSLWWRYEQSAYMVDGLTRLGILLDDPDYRKFANDNIGFVLSHPNADGSFGDPKIISRWPFAVFARAMMAEYQATRDTRILDSLGRYLRTVRPGTTCWRDICLVEALAWMFQMTGDEAYRQQAVEMWRQHNTEDIYRLDRMLSGERVVTHGVTACEIGKVPAILYALTGERRYLDAVVMYFENLFRDHELADGALSSDEDLSGHDGMMLHETCTVNDLMWALGHVLMATGDARWGDRIERAFWNASFGVTDDAFSTFQYFGSPNQVFATSRSSNDKHRMTSGEKSLARMMYRPKHDVECCAGNVHRLTPSYCSRMWMADREGGPVAALYGASRYAGVFAGRDYVIEEKTRYPFDGRIEFVFSTKKRLAGIPFSLRVPRWADGARLCRPDGQTECLSPGTFCRFVGTVDDGDRFVLDLPMHIRQERIGNGLFFSRGPVVFSLPIMANRLEDGGLMPKSTWNYGVGWFGKELDCNVRLTWGENGFPELNVQAFVIPAWKLAQEEKTPPVPGKLDVKGCGETIRLVPYLRTKLRVTVFPEVVMPCPPESGGKGMVRRDCGMARGF